MRTPVRRTLGLVTDENNVLDTFRLEVLVQVRVVKAENQDPNERRAGIQTAGLQAHLDP